MHTTLRTPAAAVAVLLALVGNAFAGGAAGGIVMRDVAATGIYDRLERWINVHNISDDTLWSVYISDVGDGSFNNDLLGNYTLYAGGSTTVEPYIDRGYCMYDAKFVFESGAEAYLWNFNLCEAVNVYVDDNGRAFIG